MSSIKKTQIDGDVSVGRNVAIGGNATIQGNTLIKKNLVIEGWLDAKNIKGANKGLFSSIDTLNASYPNPTNGWYALIGDILPAPLYIAYGGEWIATGKVSGELTLDLQVYKEALDALGVKLDDAIEQFNVLISDERDGRATADNILQTNIDNEATARATADTTLQSNLDLETTSRKQADATLQANIDAEATARANADTALGARIDDVVEQMNVLITDEIDDRTQADTALGARIDELDRKVDAEDEQIYIKIEDEATARANADTALQANITAEATERAKIMPEVEFSDKPISFGLVVPPNTIHLAEGTYKLKSVTADMTTKLSTITISSVSYREDMVIEQKYSVLLNGYCEVKNNLIYPSTSYVVMYYDGSTWVNISDLDAKTKELQEAISSITHPVIDITEMFDINTEADFSALMFERGSDLDKPLISIHAFDNSESDKDLIIKPKLGFGAKYDSFQAIRETTDGVTFNDYAISVEKEYEDLECKITVPMGVKTLDMKYYNGSNPNVSYIVTNDNVMHPFSINDTPIENLSDVNKISGTYADAIMLIGGKEVRRGDVVEINIGTDYNATTATPSQLFYYFNSAKKISIRGLKNIENIERYNFQFCHSLEFLDLSNMSNLTNIGTTFCYKCISLKEIQIGSLDFSKISVNTINAFGDGVPNSAECIIYADTLELGQAFKDKYVMLSEWSIVVNS